MALPPLGENTPIHIAWASGYPILNKGKNLEDLDKKIKNLNSSYSLSIQSHLSQLSLTEGYYANSPEKRALHLFELFTNSNIKKIWFGKAGFGAIETAAWLQKLTKNIDLTQLQPKWLIGFSDATLWHLWSKQLSWPFLHAPNLVNVREIQSDIMSGVNQETSVVEVANLLKGEKNHLEYPIEHIAGQKLIENDNYTVQLIGGNLSVILRNLAHPTLGLRTHDLSGKFLFLEDTREDAVRAHSLLTSLAASGILNEAKGIIFGDYPLEGESLNSLISRFYNDILLSGLSLDLPIYHLKNCGHGVLNRPLPLNYTGKLKVDDNDCVLKFYF